jgi:integrase
MVWPRPVDGHPWRQHDWDRWRRRKFDPAKRSAGLEDFVPYDLRHTAASLLIATGRPITEVALQLGHSPSTCADIYAHVVEKYRGQQIRSFDDLIGESRRGRKRVAQ